MTAYEPCKQDGHNHDWRDCPTPEGAVHECVFVEEREPSGRLILPPCLVCGTTAMDALEQLRSSLSNASRPTTTPPSPAVASDASALPPVGDVVTAPKHTREYHQQLLEVWHTGSVGFLPHRYRRCVFSGAGNCCCGRDDRAALHIEDAP